MPLRIWLGVVLFFVAIALFIKGSILAFALYAFVAALLLSRLIVLLATRGISVSRELSLEEANIGETLAVITKVANMGAFPILWLSVHDVLAKNLPVEGKRGELLTLLPRRTKSFLYKVTLTRRGYHQVGPLFTEAVDPFGFNRSFRRIPPADYVTVYPRILPLGGLAFPILRPSGEVRITHRAYEDPSRIRGVREYMRGDPLNRIHWKISAKLAKLYSKVYEPSAVTGITVALDFSRSNYAADASLADSEFVVERSDLAVTFAASLAYDSLKRRLKVGFLTNGIDAAERVKEEMRPKRFRRRTETEAAAEEEPRPLVGPVHTRASSSASQSLRIIRTLARLELVDDPPLEKVLFDEEGRISRDTALVVVAPKIGRVLAENITALRRAGMTVYIFLVSPYEEDLLSARTELGDYSIPMQQIGSEDDILALAVGERISV